MLSKAIVFWLRSQVDSIQALTVHIDASNRILLRGKIPQVTLTAAHGVYQGLHLSQINLRAADIQTNLRQVLKGQPLQLLQPIPVDCQLCLSAADLNCSLSTPLLKDALQDTLLPWLRSQGRLKSIQHLQPQKITLADHGLWLEGILSEAEKRLPFQLQTQLERLSPQSLALTHGTLTLPPEVKTIPLKDFTFDLGSDVCIDTITLASEGLILGGQLQINP